MVAVLEWDKLTERMQRLGRTGSVSKRADLRQVAEQLGIEAGLLREAVMLLIRHARSGPDWERSFRIRAADADPTTRHFKLQHDLGFVPNHFAVVRADNALGQLVTVDDFGDVRVVEATTRTMTFQFDGTAMTQGRAYKVCIFRGEFVPPSADGVYAALGGSSGPSDDDAGPMRGTTTFGG